MSDELFIGRQKELERLRKDFFFVAPGSYGYCNSLIGLNGVGKTTLIRRLSEEFEANPPKDTFHFETVIEDGTDFWDYWKALLTRFADEISKGYIDSMFSQPSAKQKNAVRKIKDAYDFIANETVDKLSDSYRLKLIQHLDIFKHYTTLGVRILITIDEFDRAQAVFQTGQFFQRLFNLSPKGSPKKLNLSIITISRRRVSTIAHHMQEGSNFEDAYPPIVLKGFNDEELAEYFSTYEHLPGGLLSDEEKKQIIYLCGRSPGLLMDFRHELEMINEPKRDIGQIYADHGAFIQTAYNRAITHMETTFADRAHQKPLMDIFIQKFIGPAYDDNFDIELPLLYDYGFVTKGTFESNIFMLSGEQPQETGSCPPGREVYEPVAPYFVEYIKYRIIPDKLSGLSGLLTKAEKLVRKRIEEEMRKAFPNNWEEIVNRYAGKKDPYLETLQVRALENDFSASSISKLNVISFKEYYYIIEDHWNLFSRYFTSYPSKSALFATMELLNNSRNDSAHLNLIVYNGENRRKLRETCSQFIDCLEQNGEKSAHTESSTPYEAGNLDAPENVDPFINSCVEICYQGPLVSGGKIRGVFGCFSEHPEKRGLLHINKMKRTQATPEEMEKFIRVLESRQIITVKVLSKNDKGYEYGLLDVAPSFDELINSL